MIPAACLHDAIVSVSVMTFSTLQGVIQVVIMAYYCPSEACGPLRRYFRSAQADALFMKHTSYGFDVLALVGDLRFKQHKTIGEITEALNERSRNIGDSMRLYERYLVLLRASVTDHTRIKRYAVSVKSRRW